MKYKLFLLGILLSFPVKAAEKATFAGGCFWCMEAPFEKLDGVSGVVSGYADGNLARPTYKQVSSGTTQYIEAVQVTYDPKKVSYEKLLDVFWRQIDPTDKGGQFVDRGYQYTTAIFYHSPEQQKLAQASKLKLSKGGLFGKPLVTPIKPFKSFKMAEGYHQDYYKKSSVRYKYYRYRSGRDNYLKKIWDKIKPKAETSTKPSKEELQKKLTPLQYKVTQKDGTEPPFKNKYWDNKEVGIYVDVISGEALFSSIDKYKSGTGWPSFTKPLEPSNIVEKKDFKMILPRTEIRSKKADSHVGHVFKDGPRPTGLRYCMNSAAMEFIPVAELEKRGYGKYLGLFKK